MFWITLGNLKGGAKVRQRDEKVRARSRRKHKLSRREKEANEHFGEGADGKTGFACPPGSRCQTEHKQPERSNENLTPRGGDQTWKRGMKNRCIKKANGKNDRKAGGIGPGGMEQLGQDNCKRE